MTALPRMLVTTANGRTGSAAALELLRRGFPVRAMVRRLDQRSAGLRRAGAEIIAGDIYDWRDVEKAVAGVDRIYHCPPFGTSHLHTAALFALAAQQHGVEVIAMMSGWNPHPSHPSIHQREHWISNNLYRRLGSVDVIHVNPGLFAYPYFLGLPMIHHFGLLAGPWGDGKNAPPSSEDIGAVAAGVLADPAPYVGRFLRPTGPELLSPHQIAEIMGRALGRKVAYRDVPRRMLLKATIAQGFPTFQIAQVRHYAEELKRGVYGQPPTGHVEEVTGRPAEGFESIARRYFAQPELVFPGLRPGTRIGAAALLARMMLTPAPDLDRWESRRDYPTIESPRLAHENPAWVEAAEATRLLVLEDPPTLAASPHAEAPVTAAAAVH